MQWYVLLSFLETLGNNLLSTGIVFAPCLVFSSCETKLGRVVLHYNTNKRAGGLFLFLFCSSVSWGQSWRKIARKRKLHLTAFQKKIKTTWSFVDTVMNNNPVNFVSQLEKTRGCNSLKMLSSACRWNQLVAPIFSQF